MLRSTNARPAGNFEPERLPQRLFALHNLCIDGQHLIGDDLVDEERLVINETQAGQDEQGRIGRDTQRLRQLSLFTARTTPS